MTALKYENKSTTEQQFRFAAESGELAER